MEKMFRIKSHKVIIFTCVMTSMLVNSSCKSQKKTADSYLGGVSKTDICVISPAGYAEEIQTNAVVKKDIKYGEVTGFYASREPRKKKNGKKAIVKEVFNVLEKIRKPPENISLHMDIYQPSVNYDDRKPVLLFVHGGGFYFGDKDNDLQRELTNNLVQNGCAVASMNYRLGAKFRGIDAIKMSIYCTVQDVRAALRYLTYYADELNIDPDKIYLAGSSAGGIIALTAAFMDDDEVFECCKTDFFIEHFGTLDQSGNSLDCGFGLAGVISLWGGITNLDMINERNNVPTLLFHGTADNIIYNDFGTPFADYLSNRFKERFFKRELMYGSLAIYEHMKATNMDVGYIPFDGYNHAPHAEKDGSFNENIDIIKQEMIDFVFPVSLTYFP